MSRVDRNRKGFSRSEVASFTIANGADGSGVAAVDLGRGYNYLIVKCESCIRIQAATTLSALVGYDNADTLCALKMRDDPGLAWVSSALPTTGTLAFALLHAIGVQRIQFVLSQNASGGSVVFKVYGIGGGMDD